MAETATMAEMLAALKEEIARATSLSGGPAGHEPAYRSLGDPPGRAVIEAYLQEQRSIEPKSQVLPIFFVELPPLAQERSPLVEVLSKCCLNLTRTSDRRFHHEVMLIPALSEVETKAKSGQVLRILLTHRVEKPNSLKLGKEEYLKRS